MKKKKYLIALIILVVLAAGFYFIYKQFAPKGVQGTKAYVLEVINDEGTSKKYEGKTDAEYLINLMDELAEGKNFSYESTDSGYGAFITSVNGLEADYNKDHAYWSIMVNGEYGEYGADSQPINDNDEFQLVYTKD